MMDEVDPAHHDLTRRFIAAIFVAIMGAIIALGVFPLSYASPGGGGKVVALVIVFLFVAIALVGGVFSGLFAYRIGQLGKR